MNKDIQTRWVAALRSGEYKQTQEMLCQVDGDGNPAAYCCLGGLCDLAVQDGVVAPPTVAGSTMLRFYGDRAGLLSGSNTSHLPDGVRRWAGLESVEPRLPDEAADHLPLGSSDEFHLSGLNDEGNDFATIAALIEEFGEEL